MKCHQFSLSGATTKHNAWIKYVILTEKQQVKIY